MISGAEWLGRERERSGGGWRLKRECGGAGGGEEDGREDGRSEGSRTVDKFLERENRWWQQR